MIGYFNLSVIPTCAGLTAAMFGVFFSFRNEVPYAMLCLLAAGMFDSLDGAFARKLKRTAPEKRFGIQLDSICDMVCFGVLPSCIGYALGLTQFYFVAILVLFADCALIRLAYFNVSEEQRQDTQTEKRKYYEGLPVTSAALVLPLLYCFSRLFGEFFTVIYACALVILGTLFLIRFKVRKPNTLGLVALSALGAVAAGIIVIGYIR